MKDLDFDELDKAVSSLMEKAPSEAAPAASDKKEVETVVTLPDTPATDPVKVEAATPAQPTSTPPVKDTEPEPAATPPAAVKRSGRFMDVVHPSSDMRTPSRPASRTGNTLQPMNQTDASSPAPVPDTVLPTPDAVPAPVDTPAATPEAAPDEPAATPGNNAWPDPIDMHEAGNSQPEPQPEISKQDDDAPRSDEQPTAAGSPFLPDAKVEKRPLGGSLAPTEPTKDTSIAASDAVDAVSENAKTNDVSSKSIDPMPAELGSDVLAIEAGKDNPSDKETTPQLEGGKTEPAPQPAGPTSIAQQYKIQESSGDSSHAALYDSAADSHTLTHPAKKKSGWWVVLAIVLLVLVGAGAGAYAYFSGML